MDGFISTKIKVFESTIFSMDSDNAIRLYDLKKAERFQTLRHSDMKGVKHVKLVDVSTRSHQTDMCVGLADGRINLWNLSELYFYKTDKQGLAWLIDMAEFEPDTGLENRVGSEQDVEALKQCFDRCLGFEVRVSQNLTASQLREAFRT